MLRICILILTALSAGAASASPFDIVSVSIKRLADMPAEALPNIVSNCSGLQDTAPTADSPGLSLDQILTIGEKIWSIVEAGKPVVNTVTPVAAALPRGLTCWNELAGWQPSQTQTYEVAYKNGFGSEVVRFRFRLAYTAGGGVGGHGRYLANVSVVPAELNVSWGYNFDANVAVADAVNLGTSADPIAGLELTVNWTVKTILKESVNSFHYFVQGDGVVRTAD